VRRRGCAWYACALVALLLLTGCAASNEPRTAAAEAWGTWGMALDISAAVYEQAMIGVGMASATTPPLVTPAQLAELRAAGRAVQLALEGARTALVYYGEAMARGENPPSPKELVLAAHREVFALLQLAAKYGIEYAGEGYTERPVYVGGGDL
jgi:hypothetical protein